MCPLFDGTRYTQASHEVETAGNSSRKQSFRNAQIGKDSLIWMRFIPWSLVFFRLVFAPAIVLCAVMAHT
jgi:hypothetical protein